MVQAGWLLALVSLALLQSVAGNPKSVKQLHHGNGPPYQLPEAFDGQYTNPAPNATNQVFEWWWFQALGPEVNGILPSWEATFHEGFSFTRKPTDPIWRLDVSGTFPNGTAFFISTPISTPPTIKTKGQAVYGNWGDVGTFDLSGDRKSLVLKFDNAANGLTGTVIFKNLGTAAHGPCSDSTTAPPFFSSLSQGQSLNPSEKTLYEGIGWASTMPRGSVLVDITVHGSQLYIEDAVGYHDKNWGPKGLDKFAYTWLTGQGSCGPFDLNYLEVQALGSPRSADIIKGFLAYNNKYLQNRCYVYGDERPNTVEISLNGQTTDEVTGQQVPTGLVLEYTLANGTQFVFDLHHTISVPSTPFYHRWRVGGKGGRVGGPQYDCQLIGEWLNPGQAIYAEGGKNIFDLQVPAI
ncbi:hypothetical protein V8C42DRAFT_302521 [Trichoderma barbatum]